MESHFWVETDLRSRQEVSPAAELKVVGHGSKRLRRPLVAYTTLLSVAVVVLKPILGSAFSADDTFDSFLPMNLKYSGGSFWQFVTDVVTGWRTNEGRFFPVAVIVGGISHMWFPERAGYKAAQFLLAVLVVLLVAHFVSMFLRNTWAGVLTGLLFLCSSQMRVQYDPFLQFSLQQPTLSIFVIGSFVAFLQAIRRSNTYLLFASLCLFLLANLTYESSLLFWPVFPLIALIERRHEFYRWTIPTVLSPALVAGYLLHLRSGVSGTSAGYTSNFAPTKLGLTFLKQFFASLPMTYAEVNPPTFTKGFPQHLDPSNWMWLTAIILAGVLMSMAFSRLPRTEWQRICAVAGSGLTIWFFPALVVAQTSRWQEEIVSGNAYIPVYQGNIGFSLVSLSVVLTIRRVLERRERFLKVILATLAVVVAVALSSVVTNNVIATSQYDASFRHPRDFFTNSVRNGVFSQTNEHSVILSVNSEWWFKPAFVNWYRGPHVKSFVTPQELNTYPECVADFGACRDKQGITHYMGLYGRSPNETRAIIVGRVSRMSGDAGQIKGVRVTGPLVYVEYPSQSPSLDFADSSARCAAWLLSRLRLIGESMDVTSLTVRRADRRSCLVSAPSEVSLNPLKFTAV